MNMAKTIVDEVIVPASKIALVVGSFLTLVNHGQVILQSSLNTTSVVQIGLCYLTPFCVSGYSSIKARQLNGDLNS